MAKWLLEVNPKINISIYDNFLFRKACAFGQTDIAIWFQSIRPFTYNNIKENDKLYIIVYNYKINSNNKSAALAIITFFKKKGYAQYLTPNLVCTLVIQ